jgi:RNA polymerase sigma-70 factor (ECF subfamily)
VDSRPSATAADDPEADVWRALAGGDPTRSLELLMDLYGEGIHRYCTGLLGDENLADDVLQMVFIDAFRNFASFQGRSTAKTWLYGIARNRCIDETRRRRGWRRLLHARADLSQYPDGRPSAEAAVSSRGMERHIRDCLGRLPSRAREAVVLRYHEDLSYEEIASLTGDAVVALRVRVNRALRTLRACLESKGAT